MRHVNTDGSTFKTRRRVGSDNSLSAEDAEKGAVVAAALNSIALRLAKLEANVPVEAVEFEVAFELADSVATGAGCALGPGSGVGKFVFLEHGFNGPVRWYITSWKRNGSPGQYNISEEENTGSTLNTLALRSSVPGRAVVRVERQQAGIQKDQVTRVQ